MIDSDRSHLKRGIFIVIRDDKAPFKVRLCLVFVLFSQKIPAQCQHERANSGLSVADSLLNLHTSLTCKRPRGIVFHDCSFVLRVSSSLSSSSGR